VHDANFLDPVDMVKKFQAPVFRQQDRDFGAFKGESLEPGPGFRRYNFFSSLKTVGKDKLCLF
jgi:hypothetical protein